MQIIATWTLTAALSIVPVSGVDLPSPIDVKCALPGALERALLRAARLDAADVRLHGVCEGNFKITGGRVTLRAASPGSGFAVAQDDPGIAPVLEVVDAIAVLRGTIVRGGVVGLLVHGHDAELLLIETEVYDQRDAALIAEDGAELRLFDTTVRDGNVGVVVQSGSLANVQRSHLSGFDAAMIVADASFAALSDTVIENNRVGGLNVTDRSDANVLGGAFRENAQVHVNANDWSGVSLLSGVELGSPGDTTQFAFGATRNSRVSCASTPDIYGGISVLDGASVRLSNATVEGDFLALAFADAIVRNGSVSGIVFCSDGADVICSQTTSGGVIGCPSTSCGPPPAAHLGEISRVPRLPDIQLPRFLRNRVAADAQK